ncbi:phosphatase PAP2 family protein [uncultured Rubinisphaera sp.]|uniref:phosphatase PAP2 family protein n=1 Tax=uncultured Rubinisphaera sp. TaxID=1678686 RepID=UPI0030D7BBF4
MFQRFIQWLGKHELTTLILIAVIGGGSWGFIELADEVLEGESEDFDRAVLLSMRNSEDITDPLGPVWLEEIGRDITALGGNAILIFLTLSIAGFLVLMKQKWVALFLVCAVASGMLMSSGLKLFFDRPRPDLVPHGSHVYTRSFPSGHSALSAVTYLTLGALLARVQQRRRLKAYILLQALFITIAVGTSRVYLGVHWPTDVLAGWTIGATWAAICWMIFRWFQRETQIDQPAPEKN